MDYSGNIWKYYVYKFFSSLLFFGPIVILFYLEFLSFTQMSIVMAVGLITSMTLEMPSGVWADSWGRKNIVTYGLLFVAAEFFILGFSTSFSSFIVAAIFGGFGFSFISGADTALLYDSLKLSKREKDSKKIYGKARAVRYWAIVIAALIGAPLYVKHPSWPFHISGFITLLVALFFQTLKEPKTRSSPISLSKQFSHFKKSLVVVIKKKNLLWYVFFSIFSGFSIWLFHDMLRSPYYEDIGYAISFLGVVLAIITLTRSFISYYAHKIETYLGELNSIKLILFAPIFLFTLMGLFYSRIALVFAVLLYWVWSLQEVLSEVYVHEHISSKKRATIYSIKSFATSLAILLGSLLVGVLTDLFSIQIMLFILAGFSLIISVVLLRTKK